MSNQALQKIVPCLWFDSQAEAAAKFYVSVFKRSELGRTMCYGKASAAISGKPEGSTLTVEFTIEGQQFLALNGGPQFTFTPAISFFVWYESAEEVDEKWAKLSEGGEVRMALGKYPWSEKYGWCKDRFGVDWQLMIAKTTGITPSLLFVQDKFGKAEEAINFYTSLFENSKIEMIARDEATKAVLHSIILLTGQKFVLMESGMKEHQFAFSPAVSFMVHCATPTEVDAFWDKLSAVPAAEQCGWLMDKYGVSWQIVPEGLDDMLRDHDTERSERVMRAMLQMKKLDIKKLKDAYGEVQA